MSPRSTEIAALLASRRAKFAQIACSIAGVFILCSILGFAGLIGGCRRAEPSEAPAEESSEPPWFADITAESGLNFVHDAGVSGNYFMPESLGSGAALFDF